MGEVSVGARVETASCQLKFLKALRLGLAACFPDRLTYKAPISLARTGEGGEVGGTNNNMLSLLGLTPLGYTRCAPALPSTWHQIILGVNLVRYALLRYV